MPASPSSSRRPRALLAAVLLTLGLGLLAGCGDDGAGEGAADRGGRSTAERTSTAETTARPSGSRARCFGAAAFDPRRPECRNRRYGRSVTPTPEEALDEEGVECRNVQREPFRVCVYGVPQERAEREVAVIGDSHAVHWRDGLQTVARRKRWHMYEIYRTKCPLNAYPKTSPEPDRSNCMEWNRQVTEWLRDRPEVSLVVVSQRWDIPIARRPGLTEVESQREGFVKAYRRLPDSVERLVAIRDVAYNRLDETIPCVQRAIERRRRPGVVCRVPRDEALHPDPALDAVEEVGAPRAQSIDMSDFMCDERFCPPVIGGVLARKDFGHLTHTFARTLGPYLLRRFNRLDLGSG